SLFMIASVSMTASATFRSLALQLPEVWLSPAPPDSEPERHPAIGQRQKAECTGGWRPRVSRGHRPSRNLYSHQRRPQAPLLPEVLGTRPPYLPAKLPGNRGQSLEHAALLCFLILRAFELLQFFKAHSFGFHDLLLSFSAHRVEDRARRSRSEILL